LVLTRFMGHIGQPGRRGARRLRAAPSGGA
jgi:hypothetical protein